MNREVKENNKSYKHLDATVPDHWEVVSFENVLSDIIGGGTPSKSNPSYWQGSIPWLTVKDMRTRRPKDSIDHISAQAVKDSATNIIPADTIIIATRIGLGKVIRVPFEAAINQDLKALIINKTVEKGYVEYWIVSIARHLESIGSGTTVKGIRLEQVRSLPFPLPPLDQQKLIVAEIEKQFSRLDEAVANLKRAKANLKRYKAAILKAAVEGKLTEEWRKRNPDVEPASELLEHIVSKRHATWNRNIVSRHKKKYVKAKGPEVKGLPSIPSTWIWATLPQLGELNRGKSKHRPRDDGELYGGPYPFIQTGDIRHAQGIVTKYSKTYSEKGLRQSWLWPKGTLCITIAANIADTAILGIDACFPDSVVGFIPEAGDIEVRFIEYFLRTAKENIERFAPATAQKNINLAILGNVGIPLPSKIEQRIIIAEIDRRLSVAENIGRSIDIALGRALRLRQSILKRAYTGKLVECDDQIENRVRDEQRA